MTVFFPQPRTHNYSQNYTGVFASAYGTLVVAGTTTHSLSVAAVELIPATAYDSYWVTVTFNSTVRDAVRTDCLCNIYVGASGAEQLLIPNLLAGWSASIFTNVPKAYQFPLFIPAGTRISARTQALAPAKDVYVHIRLEGGGGGFGWTGHGVESLGVSPATSTGVSCTPGTAAEGAFVSVGTTQFEWNYIVPMMHGTLSDASTSIAACNLDIGVAGAVYKGLADTPFYSHNSEAVWSVVGGRGNFINIPAGTGLQVRTQNAGAAVEPRDVGLYGVY